MPKNVIILTCGESGSSVLTALISRAGFWTGDATESVGYDTHENTELVDLDRRILTAAQCDWNNFFTPEWNTATDRIQATVEQIDDGPARAFVRKCDGRQPWIWKDPRLCYTIYYWQSFVPLSECRFIIMSRDFRQAWSSHMIKGRPPISFDNYRAVRQGPIDVAEDFLRERNLPWLTATFEGLILDPARVIDGLNAHLETSLTLDDFRAVYRGPIGELRHSRLDYVNAWARYQFHRLFSPGAVRGGSRPTVSSR